MDSLKEIIHKSIMTPMMDRRIQILQSFGLSEHIQKIKAGKCPICSVEADEKMMEMIAMLGMCEPCYQIELKNA